MTLFADFIEFTGHYLLPVNLSEVLLFQKVSLWPSISTLFCDIFQNISFLFSIEY